MLSIYGTMSIFFYSTHQHSALAEIAFLHFPFASNINFHKSIDSFSLDPDNCFPLDESVVTTVPIQIRPSYIKPRLDSSKYYHSIYDLNYKFIKNKYNAGNKKILAQVLVQAVTIMTVVI